MAPVSGVAIPPDGLTWQALVTRMENSTDDTVGFSLLMNSYVQCWNMMPHMLEPYVDGTGRLLWVHMEQEDCSPTCVIHNPSNHVMREFPTHWRADRGLMERICEHGIGHPDPDHLMYTQRIKNLETRIVESVHGCDGCCREDHE
jgi:hypothetical protein